MENLIYLGDGVYAEFDDENIRLMAGSYDNPTNVVYLGSDSLKAFLKWAKLLGSRNVRNRKLIRRERSKINSDTKE